MAVVSGSNSIYLKLFYLSFLCCLFFVPKKALKVDLVFTSNHFTRFLLFLDKKLNFSFEPYYLLPCSQVGTKQFVVLTKKLYSAGKHPSSFYTLLYYRKIVLAIDLILFFL